MNYKIILIFIFTNFHSFSEDHKNEQIPWNVLNIQGYSIDPKTNKIDDTEGFGAFDSIIQHFSPTCPTNFDNGGGKFDDNTNYLKYKYNIENVVYDPFMRTNEHNNKVLELLKIKKFDCTTSMSVLNVINNLEARLKHIKLCYDAIKNDGHAFFKIWPGNNSGIEKSSENYYQSNKDASHYVAEIKQIFGKDNVTLVDNKTIEARKK